MLCAVKHISPWHYGVPTDGTLRGFERHGCTRPQRAVYILALRVHTAVTAVFCQ